MTEVWATDRRAMTDVQVTDDYVTVSIKRWRSRLSLTVRSQEPRAAAGICEQLLSEQVDALERIVSRFRADSQLSAVNRRAGEWTPVSWSFVTLLTAGILAAERTDGLVDPCLGTLVDAAGYRRWRDGIETRRLNLVTDTPVSPQAHAAPEPVEFPAVPVATPYWQRIEVRPGLGGAQVRIPKGCQLDLGAIAKAWLADHLAERLVDGWSFDAIANMGGDIRAVGLARPWTIEADPQLDGWEPLALTVTDSGLATSGQGLRRWTTASGEIGHHIIDPRTGRPATTPWWTTSVLAADARDANTASTAAMVLGHSATDWLTAHGLDAWLVPAPGRDRREAQVLGRWPESKEVIR